MSFELQFHIDGGQVTGSQYLIRTAKHTVMLECGLIQGGREQEKRNFEPFPVHPDELDAVIISHAHIDHSGRLPQLVKLGYRGPIYAQNATRALCKIMLPDSGYLQEKEAERENRKRRRKGRNRVEPLYTREDAEHCVRQIDGVAFNKPVEVVRGLILRFHDAGHILGSSIVELTYADKSPPRTLIFSGDLGYRDAPVMDPAVRIRQADAVLMESTYGDRLHRPFDETIEELGEVFASARAAQGNVLIPAFSVGRSQDLLYLMAENYEAWGLDNWHIFLDSPMAIEATEAYSKYRHLYGAKLFGKDSNVPELPNFHMTRSTEESMAINQITSGAIIIAGSGMCTGGRILHHLKNNVWRPACHVVIVGYQASGSIGRQLVDGADEIKMWGDTYKVRARIHTIGGLSAHGDQADLVDWYAAFDNRPPVYLSHGETHAQVALMEKMQRELQAPVSIVERGRTVSI